MKGGASGAPPTGGQGLRAEPHTADVDGPVLRGLTGHRGSPTRFTGDPRHLQENHVNKGVFRGAEKAFDKIRLIHFQNSQQARSERRGPRRGCGIHEEPAGVSRVAVQTRTRPPHPRAGPRRGRPCVRHGREVTASGMKLKGGSKGTDGGREGVKLVFAHRRRDSARGKA